MGSTVARREAHQPTIDEGVHDAKIIKVEGVDDVQTQFGIKNQIWVTFLIGDTELVKRFNKSWNTNSNLYSLVAALRPAEVTKETIEYDVAELLGDHCRVLISHNMTDAGDVWENIEKVTKAKAKPKTFEEDAQDEHLV